MSDVHTFEHEQLKKDLIDQRECTESIEERLDSQMESWMRWSEGQDNKRQIFEEKMLEKLDEVRGALDRKAELDGVLLSKMKELATKVQYGEQRREKTDRSLQELIVRIEQVQKALQEANLGKLKVDVDSAHGRIRDLDVRVNVLEKAPATVVLERDATRKSKVDKLVFAVIGAAITLAVWGIQKFMEFLARRG